MSPITPISNPLVIGQADFAPLAQRWKDYVPDAAKLKACFLVAPSLLGGKDKLLQGVGFSMEQILHLVSTVGATSIRAAFIVIPNQEKGAALQFSVALYAQGLGDRRLSSYYLPHYTTTEQLPLPIPPVPKHNPGAPYTNQVANIVVQEWLDNWTKYGEGKAQYFASPYPPDYLEAYSFEVAEFSAMFYRLRGHDVKDASLELSFVLHEYWQSVTTGGATIEELVYTFGLVLRLKRGKGDSNIELTEEDPLLDMGKPCPPY